MTVCGFLALAGCASNPPAPVVDLTVQNPDLPVARAQVADGSYRVESGDTLYSIAFKHGIDYRELAAWNGIASPYRINAGQELRLSAPPAPAGLQPGEAVTSAVADHAAPAATSPLASAPAAPQPTPFPPGTTPTTTMPPPVESTAPTQKTAPSVAKIPATQPAPVPKSASASASAPHIEAAPVPQLNAGGVAWRWPADGKVVGTFFAGDQTKQGLDIAGKAGDPVRAAAAGEVVYSGNGLIGYGELVIVKHNANFLSAYGHNRKRLVKEGDKVTAGQEIAEMGSSSASRDELHFEIRKNGKPVNPLDYLPAQ